MNRNFDTEMLRLYLYVWHEHYKAEGVRKYNKAEGFVRDILKAYDFAVYFAKLM